MNHVPANVLIHLFKEKIIDGSACFSMKGGCSDGYQLLRVLAFGRFRFEKLGKMVL
jgi:hypothetical protein